MSDPPFSVPTLARNGPPFNTSFNTIVAREGVARELDRELGPPPDGPASVASPEPEADPGPLPGWSPYKLEDKSWGSCWMGDTRKLPENLVGRNIEIKTRGKDTLIRTIVKVLHRDADYVLVRDSGKG